MNWFVAREGQKFVIRKKRGKSLIRYPIQKYPNDKSKASLEAFCERLNGRANRRAIQAIKVRLAFLPVELLEDFRAKLAAEIPNQKDARYHYKNLHRYFLDYFVTELNLQDPISWKEQEYRWGAWLIRKFSPATIKGIVQTANRFMAFLHERLPREVSKIEFKPISRAKYKELSAKQKMQESKRQKLISEQQLEKLPPHLKAACLLGLWYGLRRSEIGGLRLEDVRKGHLSVERQHGNKPLKNRVQRQVPHWFCSAAKCYELIQMLIPMHPDTFGRAVGLETHDLRRTFITKALELHTPKQVMLAVGHSNIETTMRYLQDDRALDSAPYVPIRAS